MPLGRFVVVPAFFLLSCAGVSQAQVTDPIFADGFESGNVSAWATSRGGVVEAAAALAETTMGLRVNVSGPLTSYVEDRHPSGETRYRARFYFRVESLGPSTATTLPVIFAAYKKSQGFSLVAGLTSEVQLQLGRQKTSGFTLLGRVTLDSGAAVKTPAIAFNSGAHFVEFDWKAASSDKNKDGWFTLWLDNTQVAKLTGLTNAAAHIDLARLGALTVAPGLAASLSLDQFASRRMSFIGPDFSAGGIQIGEWTDSPGACPAGTNQVNLNPNFDTIVDELQNASRGMDIQFPPQPCGPPKNLAGSNGCYSQDPPNTCYFIPNGTYEQTDRVLLLYVQVGGTASSPRAFVGESRDGVILRGRISIDFDPGDLGQGATPPTVQNVLVNNLTFNLTGGLPGYGPTDSFNTLTLFQGSTNITIDHVTFTGDCATGFTGAHIETDGVNGLTVSNTLVENFGHCFAPGDGGHQDHGVYLAHGSNLTFTNNVIRGNSSRGIQLFTGSDPGDSLTNVTIQQNRIYQNGHADFEDGIVIDPPSDNADQDGNKGGISNVLIFRNLIYDNYYSGIRWAATIPPALETGIVVQNNTFDNNGVGSTSSARSEINLDGTDEEANSVVELNLFSVGNAVLNDCLDASSNSWAVTQSAMNTNATVTPPGAANDCIVLPLSAAPPLFVNQGAGDYHTVNSAVTSYGAYAP